MGCGPFSHDSDNDTEDFEGMDNRFLQLEQRLGCCPSQKRVALAMRLELQDHVAFQRRRGADEEQLVERFARILDQLPETDRLVIGLFYYDGLNFAEIAEVLNLNESAVCQKYSHALIRLCAEFPSA